jgi:hypothetical protein
MVGRENDACKGNIVALREPFLIPAVITGLGWVPFPHTLPWVSVTTLIATSP